MSALAIAPGGSLDSLRAAVRTWCADHVPHGWREAQRGAGHAELVGFLREWGAALRAGGLFAPHWPAAWSGGFSVEEQVVIAEELARGDAPRNALFHVGVFNVGPTLVHSATDAQCDRFMRGLLEGEVWCQGYSEPNAGSDLASLKTRAVRDGDTFVINGQKVWTSWAREADWCMLLARTDTDATKHQGISCLIVDMHADGVEVRPIKQAWGPSDFNEVFFDDVVIPADHVIGEVNRGWGVALGTLAAERAVSILELTERLRIHGVEAAVRAAAKWRLHDGRVALDDVKVREELAGFYAEIDVTRSLLNAMIDDVIAGADVLAVASIIKVFYSELLHRFMRTVTELQGLAGQADQAVLACSGWETGFWMNDYIHSFGWLIGGGTNEIQRNVIGERSLGLPR
jgi:alkylation response protein AidB-like acyl-CoA dehydrogenase